MIDRRRSAQDFEHEIGAIDELLDDEAQLAGDVPFGLQVAFEGLRNERDALAALRDQLADEGMAAHDLIVVLTGKPVVGHTVDTRFLASVLGKLQDVVQAFTSAMAGRPTAGGPYTAPLKRMSTLRVAGSFASSFGVALETADVQKEMELHGSAPLADAFNALIDLINSGEDPELLLTGLGSLGQRARSHYKQLLERVASKGGDIEVTWASVKGPQRASISAEKARSAAGVLDRVKEATHYEETTGLLTGGNTRLGTFELVDDRDRLLTGRLSREIKEELKLNNRIRANLHVTELTYAGLDHPKRHYRLDEFAYLGQAGE